MIPKSRLGKYAAGLLVVFFVLLVALMIGVNSGTLPRGTPLAKTAGICTMIAAIATFVTGVISLIKFKDRSFVVILVVIFGALGVILFTLETLEVILG
jgi:hypothetical protein